MPDKGWKQAERRMAGLCGTTRIPVTGERHGADWRTTVFAYQLKVRKSIPGWLFDWLSGICATATKEQRTGVLILKHPRGRDADAVVCVRFADWVALHGEAGLPETEQEAP